MITTGEEAAEKARRLSSGLFSQLIAEEHRLQLQLRNVQERIVRVALLSEAENDGDGIEEDFQQENNPGERACSTGVTKNTRAETRLLEDVIWH